MSLDVQCKKRITLYAIGHFFGRNLEIPDLNLSNKWNFIMADKDNVSLSRNNAKNKPTCLTNELKLSYGTYLFSKRVIVKTIFFHLLIPNAFTSAIYFRIFASVDSYCFSSCSSVLKLKHIIIMNKEKLLSVK